MGGGTEEATFTGTIDGNVMRGTVAVVGHPQATFVGHEPGCRPGRRAAGTAAGRGRVSATMRGDHPFESLLETSHVKLSIAILVVTAAAARGAQQAQPSATAKPAATLIKNATVLTVTKGKLENTDLLLQNGKIAQIGKNLSAPAGATGRSTRRAST